MIQSRPQFGYLGALLVWLFAYVQYAGFNVFNTVLAGDAMHATAHGAVKLWVVVATVVAFVIALFGYDLIHKAEQFLTYTFLIVFGIFTIVVLFVLHYPAGSWDFGGFKWTPFLAQFGVVAGYRSAGQSTSRTTRVICRRTSRCVRRSTGRIGLGDRWWLAHGAWRVACRIGRPEVQRFWYSGDQCRR